MSKTEKNENFSLTRRDFLRIFGQGVVALSLPPLDVSGAKIETFESAENDSPEVIRIERTSGIIVSDLTPIIAVPLRKDYFYDQRKPIEIIKLEEGVTLGYKDIFTLKIGSEGRRLTILSHITGDRAIYLAELGRGSILPVSGRYEESRTSVKGAPDGAVSEYTYSDEVYPNKIINILVAASSLLGYQEENGPFLPRKDYSLLEILQMDANRDYVQGRTSRGWIVKAGGICALASTLSKSIFLAGGSFTEKWTHPTQSQYFVGSGDSRITKRNSDATVGFGDNGEVYDFIWQIPTSDPLYLSASSSIMLISGPKAEDLGPDADARIFLTISWTKSKPKEDELGQIARVLSAYKTFRGSGGSSLILRRSVISRLPWNIESEEKELASQIFPEENVEHFAEELREDPWIRTNLTLKGLVDSYNRRVDYEYFQENPGETLGAFLKLSSWYRSFAEKENVDAALRHLDRNTYRWPRMSIQCIGWVILLSSLGSYYSPRNIEGQEIGAAAELISEEIRQRKRTYMSSNGLLFSVAENIEDVDVGDLFITYDPFTPGHAGCVIGKKEVQGKTILLISDANRKNDGKVRIFEVDQSNFDAVFGEYPQLKVLIKRGST